MQKMNSEKLRMRTGRGENTPVHISFDRTQGPDASTTIELHGDAIGIGAAASTLLLRAVKVMEPGTLKERLECLSYICEMVKNRLKEEAHDKETTDAR